MPRFYKVRIICGDVQKLEYETFIIYPNKNNFDSFMTEICARLPELFYQPFKLYYQDASGEFITIFNWLDFGVFFMQSIDRVYILKGDSKTNLHYRTVWSMPMPTATHFAAYEQFMSQPAYQLPHQTCFDFIRNADNTIPGSHLPTTAPSQNSGAQRVANAADNVGTERTGVLFDFAEAAQKKTNQNFSFNGLYRNNIADLVQNMSANTSTNPTLNATVNAVSSAATNTKLDSNKNGTNADSNQKPPDVPNENNVNTLIAAIESHRKIVENNIQKLLDKPVDEPFNDSNVYTWAKVAKKKKDKTGNKQVETQIVEPAILIGEPKLNHSFSLRDEVEVCSGDWEFLQGKITEIDGDMIKISGGITNGDLAMPLTFKASDLCKCSKPKNHGNENKLQSDLIGQEVLLSDDANKEETEKTVIKTDETVTDSKEKIFLKNDSTQLPNVPNSETTNDIRSDKDALNVPNEEQDDAIIDYTDKKVDEINDSVKLINIENSECSITPDASNNDEKAILIETGQESPTSREWSLVETAEYAESPVTVDTGTIPKAVSTQDINHGNVKRRTLPKVPVIYVEEEGGRVIPAGQVAEEIINESMSIMIGMGFSNDGNELRRLVESVDGNISSALDLLDSQ